MRTLVEMMMVDRRWANVPFAALAVCSHLYAAIVFGAVFWIDSIAYVSLGHAIVQPDGLLKFYDGCGVWFYAHLQPGVSLVWLALEALPKVWRWPAMTAFQHILAGVALVYFFATIEKYWPSRWNYLGCALIAFLPFYQAAHNSLMSESISSSLMLLGLAWSLRLRQESIFDWRKALLLMLAIIAVTQFRGYFGMLLFGASTILLFRRELSFWRRSSALAAALVVGIVAFPAYRFAETGNFWLPNLGMNKLQAGWRVNPEPSAETLKKLEDFHFPPDLSPLSRVDRGLDYNEAAAVALAWRKLGLSDREIGARAAEAGALLANDGPRAWLNRAFFALTSTGMLLPYCLLDANEIVYPGYSAARMCDHVRQTYSFHSWLSSDSHVELFDRFFDRDTSGELFHIQFQTESAHDIRDETRGYLKASRLAAKDPFRIGKLAPDLLIVLALVAMALASRQQRPFALACAWLVIGNAVVNFLAPLGNPRYGYFLFPIYFAFAMLGFARFTDWLRFALKPKRVSRD